MPSTRQERPPAEQHALDGLVGASTAVISDVLGALGDVAGPLRGLAPVGQSAPKLLGTAVTVRYGPASRSRSFAEAPLLINDVIDEARPGDVLVLAGDGAALALWGDHMSARALRRGLAGALVDGMVRDAAGIAALDLPVFAAGRTPETCLGRLEVVGRQEPVRCCGTVIAPGDVVVGDGDGVLVVPARMVPSVSAGVERMRDLDVWLEEAAAAGADPREMYTEIARRLTQLRDLDG